MYWNRNYNIIVVVVVNLTIVPEETSAKILTLGGLRRGNRDVTQRGFVNGGDSVVVKSNRELYGQRHSVW